MSQESKTSKGISFIIGTIFFYIAIGYVISISSSLAISDILNLLLVPLFQNSKFFSYNFLSIAEQIMNGFLFVIILFFSIKIGVKNALRNTVIKKEDFLKISALEAGIIFSILFIMLSITGIFFFSPMIYQLKVLGGLFILEFLPIGVITYYWLRKLTIFYLNNQANILQGKDDGIISSAKNENSINKAWKFVKTNYCIKGIICIFLSILFFSRYGGRNMSSLAIFISLEFLLIFCLWSLSLVFFFTSIFKDKIIYKGLSIFGLVISFLTLVLFMFSSLS